MKRRSFFKLAGLASAAVASGAMFYGCNDTEAPFEEHEDSNLMVSAGAPIHFSEQTDVLVIGSGIAGLSAAMDPSEAGRSVIVAEKLELLGGESYDATGMIYTAATDIQKKAGITTSLEKAWSEIESDFKSQGLGGSMDFEKTLFKTGSEWVNRIASDYGSKFKDPKEYFKKDVSGDNFLLPEAGLGDMESIMSPIRDKLASQGVSFMLGMKAYMFILDEHSHPVGVRFYLSKTNTVADIRAKKIVIATGGYICNQALVKEYIPNQVKLACYTTHADGSGHELCTRIQGTLAHMEAAAPPTSDLPHVDTWGYFGPIINVSPLGKRIAREDQLGATALACAKEELGFWWSIFDKSLSENGLSRSVSFVTSQNATRMVGPCNTLEELADKTDLSHDVLKTCFDEYKKAVEAKKDTEFGKTAFLENLAPPFYAAKQFPNRFRSFGGVVTDDGARMLDAFGNPIQNVFCCGACGAGSFSGLSSHGAFGMIAGRSVVASLEADEANES